MRFDDSLETVLAADMSSPFGAQSAWRQLVDLVGRRRVLATNSTIARLRALRHKVPPPVRAASARGIADANLPVALVRLFADDEIVVAAPILRAAILPPREWIAMLPAMSPATRSILRHRRDMAPEVMRALESFGSVDFVLSPPTSDIVAINHDAAPIFDAPEPAPLVGLPDNDDLSPEAAPTPAALLVSDGDDASSGVAPDVAADLAPVTTDAGSEAAVNGSMLDHIPADSPMTTSFVSFATIAQGLPVVAEAMRQSNSVTTDEPQVEADSAEPDSEIIGDSDVVNGPAAAGPDSASIAAASESLPVAPDEALSLSGRAQTPPPVPQPESGAGTFQIAELVARIDAFQRQREDSPALPLRSIGPEVQPELFALDHVPAERFRFETDAAGVVRWIEGASRAPLIGLSLDLTTLPVSSRVDGVAAGAFRRRASFTNARLVVEGQSDAAGQWRISGIPAFDNATGRFTGYRGSARRPRADEMAEPPREGRNPASDALRQLVHELRTPANAIAGFAEMIESQLLGPVPQPYRTHASAIRSQTHDLLGAIDDIDMAARIESDALDLRTSDVPVAPMLSRIAQDLASLATLRGVSLVIDPGADGIAIAGDDRAVERLVARLMATLVSSGSRDERIAVTAGGEGDRTVVLTIDRPRALGAYAEEKLLTIDAEVEAEREGAPLLGTGFALRLARNLAVELGGTLTIGEDCLTLRLPAAFLPHVEQVSLN